MSTNLKAISSQDFCPTVDLTKRGVEDENIVIALAAIGAFLFAIWFCKAVLHGKVTIGFPWVYQCTF